MLNFTVGPVMSSAEVLSVVQSKFLILEHLNSLMLCLKMRSCFLSWLALQRARVLHSDRIWYCCDGGSGSESAFL